MSLSFAFESQDFCCAENLIFLLSHLPFVWITCDEIDKIVGFHDVTRLTTLRNSAMLDPSHPDTKARCTGDGEYGSPL